MLHGFDAMLFSLHVYYGYSLSEVARITKRRKADVLARWQYVRGVIGPALGYDGLPAQVLLRAAEVAQDPPRSLGSAANRH